MLRKLLTIALPLLLPLLLYYIYLMLARRRAQRTGTGAPPRWQQAPWAWIALAGVVLMIASLATFGMTSGVEPGGRLTPPRWVDGEVVPSQAIEE